MAILTTYTRMPAVKTAVGMCERSVYQLCANGLLPQPVKLGRRASAWPSHEIEAVTAARAAGADDSAIRDLVKQLHAARAERWANMQSRLAVPATPTAVII